MLTVVYLVERRLINYCNQVDLSIFLRALIWAAKVSAVGIENCTLSGALSENVE